MKRTRIFFLLFAICLVLAACSVQKPETTTPVADTTTAEPGTTSVAEPATEPVPAALPEFQADGIVILPEGEWGLFRYYVNQDVEIAEIKTLADLFSGEPVVAAEESPGPWMNVRFTQTESEVASFFISRDNVIRYYDTKGNVCYIRLAVDKPLYDTVSGYYRQYAESPGADDDFALMEVYLRDKMLKFYEEGSTAVRLESCKEYASIEVGVDYTFRLYRAVMRVRPQERHPGVLRIAPWPQYTYFIPVLVDRKANTSICLEKDFVYVRTSSLMETSPAVNPKDAFIQTALSSAVLADCVADCYPSVGLLLIESMGGTVALSEGDGIASPAYPLEVGLVFSDILDEIRWHPAEPAETSGLGVRFAASDGKLRVTVFENGYARVQSEDREMWYQSEYVPLRAAEFDPDYTYKYYTSACIACHRNTAYDAMRFIFDSLEYRPQNIVLHTNTADFETIAKEFAALWGEHLQHLTPGNVFAVTSFATADNVSISPPWISTPNPSFVAYVDFYIQPASKAGILVWHRDRPEKGPLCMPGVFQLEQTAEGEWRLLAFHYAFPGPI